MENQLDNKPNNDRVYAGFGIRFLARLTDWFILFTPQALFWWWAGRSINSLTSLTSNLIAYVTIFLILGFVIGALYYSLTTSIWGATPGKLLAGLRVTDENGQNLTLGRALFRHTIGYWVSALLWGLGYFWIVRDKNKQGWHDQITGSYVVQTRKNRWLLLLIILVVLLSVDTVSAASGVGQITSNKQLRRDVEKFSEIINAAFERTIEINQPDQQLRYEYQYPEVPDQTISQDGSRSSEEDWEKQQMQ